MQGMKCIATVVIVVNLFTYSFADQKTPLSCRLLNESNGLSDNRVTDLFKDRSGYMWIGTANGLNRYDGQNFVQYHPRELVKRLSNEFITGIGQDERGDLWVSTKNGLNQLFLDKDSVSIFLPKPNQSPHDPTSLSNSLLWDLFVQGSKVWLAIDNRDLCYYDIRNKVFRYFPWKDFVARIFPAYAQEYRAIQSIQEGYPNGLLLGTNMGLFGFDTLSLAFEFLGGGQREDVMFLTGGNNEALEAMAIFRQEFSGWGIWQQSSGYNSIEDDKLAAFIEEVKPQFNFWLSIDKKLWRYDKMRHRNDQVELVINDRFETPELKFSFTEESQNCQWLASAEGCYIYSDFLNLFPFTSVLAGTSDLPVTIQNAIELDDGSIWVANINGELVNYNQQAPPRYFNRINGIELKEPSFLFEDSKGIFWVLTRKHVFYKSGGETFFRELNVPFPGEKVFSVVREDASGNLWFGTVNQGVYQWIRQEDRWVEIVDPTQPVPLYVRDLLIDKNGEFIWIATVNVGLVRLNLESGEFRYYSKDNYPANGLLAASFTCLAQGEDRAVWIGSEWGGLSRYEGEIGGQERFTTFTTRDGLPENTIHGILSGRGRGLWVSTARGLAYFDGKEKIVRQWLSTEQETMVPVRALLHFRSQSDFLLPVKKGFLKINHSQQAGDFLKYPIVFQEIKINDSISTIEHPILKYRDRQISFKFQLLRYDTPARVNYEYKLEGLNPTWERNSSSEVHYVSLSPGRYRFLVRATDSLGNLLSDELSYAFEIRKPWWLWWQLWVLFSCLVGVGIFLWWRRLNRQLREEKIINYFATSLYGRNTVEDVFWDIAENCIGQLGFEDCVIYQYDKANGFLVQKAAYGPKSPGKFEILNPITIPLGEGITGYAALLGKPLRVADTTKDKRYIIDDQFRYSELAVPILVDGEVFGVIDSEHSKKNFFTRQHLRVLQKIAGLCNQKLTRYLAEEKIRSTIARDLHDEIGSTLTSINIMSKIASEHENPKKVQDYLGSIRENSRQMMDAMSDMVWAINPENDSLSRMFMRLKVFAAEILEPLAMRYTFHMDPDLQDFRLNLNVRKDLYLILKEAVTNTAKYSQATQLEVIFHKQGNNLSITVQDNGVGMPVGQALGGNGIKNMHYRANHIKASIQVESSQGLGTKILMIMPLT